MPRKENQSNSRTACALDANTLGPIGGGGDPLYVHVYRRLAQLIESGALVEGARLPPSRFLAGQLAVSRFTVAYAYNLLAADGYILGRGRAGTFVRPLHARQALPAESANTPAQITGRGSTAGPQALASAASSVPLFSVGIPPVEFFPRKVWVNLVKRRLAGLALADLLPGDPQGSPVLRRALANRLAITRGIVCSPDQIFVTAGIAGATALAAAATVATGEPVLVEDPTDPRCVDGLRAAGAEVVAVPVDENGMNVEAGLALCARPRLAVVTPCCQFPMGVILSAPRRALLLGAARRGGGFVLEHDIPSDYRFAGPQVRSMASEAGADADAVIYALHLSETVFPALAISCVAVPRRLVSRFRNACERLAPLSNHVEQAALVDLVRHGHILRYFAASFSASTRRRDALHAAFAERGTRVYVPDAGLHLIVAMQRPLDDAALARLHALGMAPVPLARYAQSERQPHGLAVGFASVPESRAREAVRQLAQCVDLAESDSPSG